MSVTIRQSKPSDTTEWLSLVKSALGDDHPTRKIYDPDWIRAELDPAAGHDTWVAVIDGVIQASLSLLGPFAMTDNPVGNLGRNLFRPESYENGAAEALLRKVVGLCTRKECMAVVRLLASDNAQQVLFENLGFVCVGYQPLKHQHKAREEVLFYVKPAASRLPKRLPLSDSLPQICELASAALENLQIPTQLKVRDGVAGYPITTEITIDEATLDDYESWRMQSQTANPPREISGSFNWGFGFMRVTGASPLRALLGLREGKIVAGLRYYFDEADRCVRLVDAFSADDLSMGAMFNHLTKVAQGQFNAAYLEVDILVTAPRLLKTAEQVGFIPVAYLPAFFVREESHTDVVKMVKLNMPYAPTDATLTSHATAIMTIVHHALQDQKLGVAIINLLRGLKMFTGLGDGELRKIARLFTQKLYRPGDKIFNRDDKGQEAYVVLRGQIGIYLDENAKAIATVEVGQIFGEVAFLDGTTRGALAVANQATILLVMQRTGFNDLVEREPHLGMSVMRNIALELAQKLRRSNEAATAEKDT